MKNSLTGWKVFRRISALQRGTAKKNWDGLKKFTRAHLHLFASNSRYETEDQSEYRTDEEEANGLPQTDLDERETEIGCKPN